MRNRVCLKYLFIFLQSTILFAHIGWASEDAKEEVAAIRILPYHYVPSGSLTPSMPPPPALQKFNPHVMYGRRYSSTMGEVNEYGLGSTFSYLTKEEVTNSGNGEAIKRFMPQLVSYHKSFNDGPGSNKNVLLVRMRITIAGDKVEQYEYLLGIFTSGGQNYRCGEIRNLTEVRPDLPDLLRGCIEYQRFCELWGSESVRTHLKEYSLISDNIPAIVSQEKAEDVLSEGVYKTKIFRLQINDHTTKKLAPFSNHWTTDLEKTMTSRLFYFPFDEKLNLLFNAPPVSPSKELEVSMQKEVTGMHREELTQKLFGKPSYKDCGSLKACLNKKTDLEMCFNQSEQSFLSWMEKIEFEDNANINRLPHCYATRPLKPGNYDVSKIEIDLYSFLDICRYCRGTLAHMVGSRKMLATVIDFFKRLGITINFIGENIEILAFSYEKTDI